MLPKVVVMDLGDTIIDIKQLDFYRGFKYIYDHYCKHDISYEELLKDLDYIQKVAFPSRNNDDIEISFINYLRYIGQVVGYLEDYDLYKLEEEYIRVAFDCTLFDHLVAFLQLLKDKNIDVYVLSNSTFSTNGLKSQLNDFGLLGYFKDVYSSCDYILRKPNPMYFNVIKKPLMKQYSITNSNDIWYIGNDYHFDVKGSVRSGLTSVWFNVGHQTNVDSVKCIEVDSYSSLIRMIEGKDHE